MIIADKFQQIILHESTKELVSFLLQLEKKDIIPVRQRLLVLRKELQEARQINERHWGSLETAEQAIMLFLSGLAVYSRKEGVQKWFQLPWSFRGKNLDANTQSLLVITQYFQPAWLTEWVKRTDVWSSLTYWILRELERRQLIEYQASVWAQKLGHILFYPASTKNYEPIIIQLLQNDETALRRDLPLLFDFDTTVDSVFTTGIAHQLKWLNIIAHLTATRHLDRADILTRCLLALRRDFRRPLLTWFKDLFLSLKPTRAERLARQADLTELLAHPLPLVVNFAIEQLKDVWPEPGFALAPLLHFADILLLRPDLKTGLKTLLAGLAKLPKQNAAHAPAVARLLAAALAHPDASVQERAAKGLADLLAAKKPLLPPTETAEILATLPGQAELLGPAARTVLAPWLAAPTPAPAAEAAATYAPLAQFVPEISPATAIALVADWHELLFLTGQVLRHDDPLALERWLDGLLRLHGHLPAGYAAQLEPYLVQVLPELRKLTQPEAAALVAGPIAIWWHDGLAQALLLSWANGFVTPRVPDVEITATHYARTPLLPLDKERYAQAEKLLQQRQSLPLLSTPTHLPHWVAPTALVNRLLTYQQAATEPAVADLLIALARTAHAHPAEAAAALQLLPQLHNAELRELLAWFFSPALAVPTFGILPTRRPAELNASLAGALPELWAVAARTKAPASIFPTLAVRLGYDYAGITCPLRPLPAITTGENNYPQFHLPGQPATVYRWTEIHWSSGADEPPPSPLLLYSPPAPQEKQGSWEHNMLLKNDFQFLASLLPNYSGPLYEYVLRSAAWADNLESSERDLVALALRALLGPGPAFDLTTSALLASGLIHHTPLCRSLGQEVLMQAITNGRLVPTCLGQVLGQQLAVGYAPLARLADNLAPLRAISPAMDDALRQVLATLLTELPALPPRNLRKLLETYADLVARTSRPVPPAVRERLVEWSQTAALKKLAASLL